MKKRNQSMLQGPLFSGILLYTVPIILTSLLQLLFNAADLVVVGRFCGSISVAAVSATGSITALIVNLFIGISTGAGVTLAHALGSRQEQEAHRTVHTALLTALVSGIFLTVVGIAFSGVFLRLMDTPENVLPLSTVYMRIYFGGAAFNMVYNFCAAILRAAGDTKSPLVFLSAAGVLNVVLNVIFVTQLHMNVAGVALATAISQAVSAVLVALALMRRTDACKLELGKLRVYKPQLAKILRIGLPAGLQSSLFSISNVLIQSSINSFGDVVMSGNGAAQNIEGFVYTSMNAFYQTAMNYIGQNAGAGQYKRVRKVFFTCLGCVTVVGAGLGNLACAFGPELLGIYITDSQAAITYGVNRLGIVAAWYFLCGMMDISTGALRGLGVSFTPMLISVIGICGLRIGWIYTIFQLSQFHTPRCLYWSYPVSWVITFLCQTALFLHVYRKRARAMERANI